MKAAVLRTPGGDRIRVMVYPVSKVGAIGGVAVRLGESKQRQAAAVAEQRRRQEVERQHNIKRQQELKELKAARMAEEEKAAAAMRSRLRAEKMRQRKAAGVRKAVETRRINQAESKRLEEESKARHVPRQSSGPSEYCRRIHQRIAVIGLEFERVAKTSAWKSSVPESFCAYIRPIHRLRQKNPSNCSIVPWHTGER